MNVARANRGLQKALAIENNLLTPGQQIRLHFRCLVRAHRLDKLGWHLKGIGRALLLPSLAD
ncbi:MAG TPA: hypothetical protein VIT23_11790 [Terrimicrobiaceae bacterium]